jgi:hypothetical protein
MLFQQSWKSSHICWALVGSFSFTLWSNSSQTISIRLTSGHLMQHSITLLDQKALTQPGVMLGHCPVEKQMMVPLSVQTRWDGVSLQIDVVTVPWILNKSVSPAKHPHTITSLPPCVTVGTKHAEIIRSPTLSQRHLSWNQKSQIRTYQTDFHKSNVHCSCFLTQASLLLFGVIYWWFLFSNSTMKAPLNN